MHEKGNVQFTEFTWDPRHGGQELRGPGSMWHNQSDHSHILSGSCPRLYCHCHWPRRLTSNSLWVFVSLSLYSQFQVGPSDWPYLGPRSWWRALEGEKREYLFPSLFTSLCSVASISISFYCCIIRTRFKMSLIYYLTASVGHDSSIASSL